MKISIRNKKINIIFSYQCCCAPPTIHLYHSQSMSLIFDNGLRFYFLLHLLLFSQVRIFLDIFSTHTLTWLEWSTFFVWHRQTHKLCWHLKFFFSNEKKSISKPSMMMTIDWTSKTMDHDHHHLNILTTLKLEPNENKPWKCSRKNKKK